MNFQSANDMINVTADKFVVYPETDSWIIACISKRFRFLLNVEFSSVDTYLCITMLSLQWPHVGVMASQANDNSLVGSGYQNENTRAPHYSL